MQSPINGMRRGARITRLPLPSITMTQGGPVPGSVDLGSPLDVAAPGDGPQQAGAQMATGGCGCTKGAPPPGPSVPPPAPAPQPQQPAPSSTVQQPQTPPRSHVAPAPAPPAAVQQPPASRVSFPPATSPTHQAPPPGNLRTTGAGSAFLDDVWRKRTTGQRVAIGAGAAVGAALIFGLLAHAISGHEETDYEPEADAPEDLDDEDEEFARELDEAFRDDPDDLEDVP